MSDQAICALCGVSPVVPGTAGCRECTRYARETVGVPEFQGIQPEMVSVDRELLIGALVVAEDAYEWAVELLAVHDAHLGRTTRKNRMWAQHLETRIVAAKASIAELRKAVGHS